MTRWTTRVGLLSALLFAAVPLAFLLAITLLQLVSAVPDARQARADTIAAFRSIRAANAVDQAVQDAERGQRGFLITGREPYLEPYLRAKAQLPGLMTSLQQATQDSAEQQARVLTLQAHLTTKLNELDTTIQAYRDHGFEVARGVVDSDIGRRSMEAIQADLSAIMDTANAELSTRLALAEAADRQVTTIFVILSLISALALIAGGMLLAHAYRRLAGSEMVLRSTLDSMREGVAAFDGAGRLRVSNAVFARLFELDPAILKQSEPIPSGREAPPGAADLAARIAELDAAAQRAGRPALVSYRSSRGATLELYLNRVADGYVATVLDVSEQRQAEEALRQSQKLEALGQMTGGVAHDFNNLLQIMIGSLGFLRRSLGDDAKSSRRIEMLAIAAERGARLTKQLLAFARRQPLEPQVINLGQVMQEILPLLRRAVGESVLVECVAAGGLWNTTVDVAQFHSAVLNLAINSRDAMPEGGKLTIEVANVALDDIYAARHAEVEPGQYVLFAITDTGKGMDAPTMARALDPFFTTKTKGEGTGLGLSQVYGFVKQSGGHIKLYSEIGEGTAVKIYLPRSLQEAPPETARQPQLAVTGTETVLLVDDDEIVRASVASMLEDLGYTVLTAAGGAQALAMLERGAAADLLFTDVVMPGMGGRQLAEQARTMVPALRVLFTSGYTENAIVHNGRLDPGVELLSKPYDRDRLAAKLRKVLDGPVQSAGASAGDREQPAGSPGDPRPREA